MYFNKVIRMKKKQSTKESDMSFSIHGVIFASRTAAAKEMVSKGMSIADSARMSGLTYQTVYVNTVGVEKTAKRLAKYRAVRLASSSRNYTLTDIASKVGMPKSTVSDMIRRANLVG